MTSKLVLDLEKLLYVNHTRSLDRMRVHQCDTLVLSGLSTSGFRFRDLFTNLDFNIKYSIRFRRYKLLY
jgi:hypothetical protein